MITIDLRTADQREYEAYGVTYRSVHVYKLRGARNTGFPHRIVVWDNTGRRNPHPGEVRFTDHGTIGGKGRYLDPHNKGTDDRTSFTIVAESFVITNNGTNTGTPASGQVYADDMLEAGASVMLRYPEGTLCGPFVVSARHWADPVLTLATT